MIPLHSRQDSDFLVACRADKTSLRYGIRLSIPENNGDESLPPNILLYPRGLLANSFHMQVIHQLDEHHKYLYKLTFH